MKKIYLLFTVLLFFIQASYSQTASQYTFSTSISSSLALDRNGNAVDMSTGTTQLVAAGSDDGVSAVTNIGFNFTFLSSGGTNNIFTQFSASANGAIRLGSTAILGSLYGNAFPVSGQAIIAPYLQDQQINSTGKVHYKLIGSYPNRTLVVEFLNMQINYNSNTADGTYQVRLYEQTNVIEFVYGSMSVGSTSTTNASSPAAARNVSIGFCNSSTTDNVFSVSQSSPYTTSTSTTAITNTNSSTGVIVGLNSTANGSRRAFIFTPTVAYKSQFISMNTGSTTWCAGETRNVTVTIKNIGTATWTTSSPEVNIGAKFNANADYDYRVSAGSLAPGAQATYTIQITAPSAASTTENISFDVVKEQLCWFRDNLTGCAGPGNMNYVSPAAQTIVALPQGSLTSNISPICSGSTGQLKFTASTGTAPFTIVYNDGTADRTATNVNSGTAFNVAINPSSTTTYTLVSVTSASAGNSCGRTSGFTGGTATITVNPLPTITGTLSFCLGSTTQLTGSGTAAASNPWTSSNVNVATVSTTGLVTAVAAGTSVITYTNNTGCSSTVTVTVNAKPTVAVAPPSATVCSGTPTTLNATGANTYTWTPSAGLSATSGASVTATPTATTTYTVTGTTTATGCTNTATSAITVSQPPTASNAGPNQTLCGTSTVTLAANVPASGSGIWSVSGPSTSTSQFSSTTSPTATFTPANGTGAYVLTWTISNSPCTASSSSVTITYNAKPTVVVSPASATVCNGTSTVLNASGANTYAWSPSTGLSATTGSSVTATPTATTTYTVTGTTTATGCTNTATSAITVSQPPTASNAGPNQTFCGTQAATLAANAPASGTGAWSVASGPSNSTSQFSSTSSRTATFTPAGGTGVYVLTWTISSSPCTASSSNVTITYNAIPTVTVSPTSATVCSGTPTTLNASGANTYAWTPSTGLSATTGASVTATPTATTTYTVTGTAANGCTNTATSAITVNPLPSIVSLTANPSAICLGASSNLNATGTSVNGTQAGFTGFYAPSNWTISNSSIIIFTNNGIVTTSTAPTSISIQSGNNGYIFGNTDFSKGVIAVSGTISFNWSYTTTDANGPSADFPEYVLDGTATVLPGYSFVGSNSQSGTATISVTAGQTFALRMVTFDGSNGRATTVFSNFSGPAVVPATINYYTTAAGGTSIGSTASGVNFSVTPSSTGSVNYFAEALSPSTNCVSSSRSVVSLTVSPTSVAGTISSSGNGFVCSGTNSTTLTLSGNTGTIQWQSSSDNVTFANISGQTGQTYTATNLTTTTYYRAVVKSGTCSAAVTASVSITISPNATAGTISGTTPLCSGTTATFTSNGTTGGTWSSSSTAVATVNASTGAVTAVTAGTATITYSAVGCNPSAPANFTLTVNASPSDNLQIAGVPATICTGTGTAVVISGGTPSYTVYYTIDGGTETSSVLTAGGNVTLNTPTYNVAGSHIYKITGESNSTCRTNLSGPSVTITVNQTPAVTAISGPIYLGQGNTGTYSDATTGGTWSVSSSTVLTLNSASANPATASITGSTLGAADVIYTLTSNGCNAAATKTVQVYNPLLTWYRSQTDGNFNTAATWEVRDDNGSWATAATPPDGNSNIEVRHQVTLDVNYSGSNMASFAITNIGANNGSFIITPNHFFQSQGGVNFNSKSVIIQSTSAGTGAIGQIAGTIAGADHVTAERYIDGGNPTNGKRAWRLITVPLTGVNINSAWQEGQVYNSSANPATNYLTGTTTAATQPAKYGTLITSNIANAAAANSEGYDYTGGGVSIKQYAPTGTSGSWLPLADNQSSANPKLGTLQDISVQPAYMLFVRGDRSIGANTSLASITTLRPLGSLRQGSQVIGTVHGGNTYEVAGNPYASAIDFSLVYSQNSNLIKDQYAVWVSKLGTYGAYVYVASDGNGGYTATPNPLDGTGSSIPTGDHYLHSGEGFLVYPNTATGDITVNETVKAPGQQAPVSTFRLSPSTDRKLYVNLNQKTSDTSVTLADGFMVRFDPSYTSAIDGDDAQKPVNFNENLGILSHGSDFIVEARADLEKTDTVQLHLWNTTIRSYQLQIKGDNFASAAGLHAFLEDSYLKTRQEVSLAGSVTTVDFAVNSDAASYDHSRFRIVFQNDATVLPVTLTSVKAAPASGGVNVSWTVTNETNMKRYTVERSIDGGTTYTTIATQEAKNNPAAALTSYQSFDALPKTGDNLYRIRMEANNGQVSYSSVVKVTLGGDGEGIQITLYPNPVRANGKVSLQLANLKAGAYLVSVYSSAGQTVYQKKITIAQSNTTQSEELKLGSGLAQGSYPVRITDSKGTLIYTDKLVVGR